MYKRHRKSIILTWVVCYYINSLLCNDIGFLSLSMQMCKYECYVCTSIMLCLQCIHILSGGGQPVLHAKLFVLNNDLN